MPEGRGKAQSATVDGRRLRSDASRQRIVEAMIALVGEGVLVPTAEQVSERAGLTMRTVFRHFDDMESLYREISTRIYEETRACFVADDGEHGAGNWVDALHAMVERRTAVYERLYPMRVAADAIRHRSPFLQEDHRAYVVMLRRALLKVLPDDVAADSVLLEALDALFSFEFWIRLRRDQRLSVARAQDTLQGTVDRLLQTSPVRNSRRGKARRLPPP